MDGFANFEGALVIATSNRPDAIDPALRRPGRLDTELGVGLPDRPDRLAILQSYLGRMPLDDGAVAETQAIADNTHGYVAADLLAICQGAGAAAVRRSLRARRSAEHVSAVVTRDDLRAARAAVQPSLLRGSVARRPSLAVADLDPRASATAEKLLARIEEHSTGARLLITGAPSRAVAQVNEAIAARLEATSADLLTAWFGETEAAVRDLFTLGRVITPALVHLRNVHNLAPAAKDMSSQQLRRISDQLAYEVEHSGDLHVIASCTDAADVDLVLRSAFYEEIEF